MKLYFIENKNKLDEFIKDKNRHLRMRSGYSINFSTLGDIKMINDYVQKNGMDGLSRLYKNIGIKFDRVINENGDIIIDGNIVQPMSLATSERNLLYVMLCKDSGKQAFIIGLLEGLDYEHRQVFINTFRNSNDNIEVLLLSGKETIDLEDMVMSSYEEK